MRTQATEDGRWEYYRYEQRWTVPRRMPAVHANGIANGQASVPPAFRVSGCLLQLHGCSHEIAASPESWFGSSAYEVAQLRHISAEHRDSCSSWFIARARDDHSTIIIVISFIHASCYGVSSR